jgi:hypothetical protein
MTDIKKLLTFWTVYIMSFITIIILKNASETGPNLRSIVLNNKKGRWVMSKNCNSTNVPSSKLLEGFERCKFLRR